MKVQKKAGALTPTRTQNYQSQSYRKDYRLSNLELQLGELLFFLNSPLGQNRRSELEQAFEKKLNEYIDLKYAGVRLLGQNLQKTGDVDRQP
jgi:hypothetical protein